VVKSVEYNVDSIDENDFAKPTCVNMDLKMLSDLLLSKDNYLRFENKDNFSGKVGSCYNTIKS
jgi:hypothetical protein